MDGSSIIEQLADAPLSDLEEFAAAIQARLDVEELEIQLEDAQRNAEAIRAECGSFKAFVRRAWKIIEPGTKLRWNWHLDAMCLPHESLIETEEGPKPIGDIVEQGWQGRVLSYNHRANRAEWRPITRHVRSPRGHLLEIEASSGLSVKATGNHPVFVVGKGYVRADEVRVGDRLLDMRDAAPAIRAPETVLQQGMSLRASPRRDVANVRNDLPAMRHLVPSLASADAGRLLLAPMLRSVEGGRGSAPMPGLRQAENMGRQGLPGVLGQGQAQGPRVSMRPLPQAGLSNTGANRSVFAATRRVLRQELPRGVHRRGEQRGLCGWPPARDVWARLAGGEEGYSGSRRGEVLSLSHDEGAGRAPHRSQQVEPRPCQSRDALPALSRCPAHPAAGSRAGPREVTVTSIVRDARLSEPLFNLEVEANHNYVANGLLLHNCDHLEAISRGELSPRLIINVPPGSSKSTIVTVLWQAWEWGPLGKPHRKFLTSSFDGDNVTRDTRKTRNLIQSEWYRTLWPEVFDARGKLKRAGETSFENIHTGTREGVAFYSIMGKRGDVVIIDDPHSLLEAESDTQRKKATRAFIEGGLSRVNDELTSAMVIVMQRLHADDLTGALLAHDVGFIHLMIPMEFEESRRCTTPLKVTDPTTGEKKDWTDPRSYEAELLDEDRFPQSVVDQKKKSPYSYAGQYLQRPAPREGGLFKVEKIRTVEYPEPGGKLVRGWDLAASIEEGAAYTVGVLMRLLPDGQIYIEDVVRFRGTPFEVDRMINKTARADGIHVKQSLPQDPGAAGKAVKWGFAKLLSGLDFEVTPETGDKETRARPFASQVEAGTVAMVHASWNSDYKEELRNFPTGSYKDQVDASSRAYAKLIKGFTLTSNAGPEVVHGEGEDGGDDMELVGPDGEEIDPWAGT